MRYLFTKCLSEMQGYPNRNKYLVLFIVLSVIYGKTLGLGWLVAIYIFLVMVLISRVQEKERERLENQNEWVIKFSEKALLSFVGNRTIESAVMTSFNALREDLPFEDLQGGQHMGAIGIVHRLEVAIESDHTRQLLYVLSQCVSDGNRMEGNAYYSWVKEMLTIKQIVMRGKLEKASTLVATCNLVIFLGMMLMMMLPSMMQMLTM